MRARRIVAAICFVVLTAVDSSAFKPDIHIAISKEALGAPVGDALPESIKQALRDIGLEGTGQSAPSFTDDALKEIGDANQAMDTGECGNLRENTPASPCVVETEDLAAFVQLLTKGATEAAHFDAEKIQEGSDLVFTHSQTIRRHILDGNFVSARRVLGNALHSIQDFYTHTNWVELGRPGRDRIDYRLGSGKNAMSGGSPRIALPHEPMCVEVGLEETWLDNLGTNVGSVARWIGTHLEGSIPFQQAAAGPDRVRLLTQLSKADQDKLIKIYADAEAKAKAEGRKFNSAITAQTLTKVLADRPLTSGHFYLFYPEPKYTLQELPTFDDFLEVLELPGTDDIPAVVEFGKCRHGWHRTYTNWTQAQLTYRQAGIHKDEKGRAGHEQARESATTHSMKFVMAIINDPALARRPDYTDRILGFLGYEAAGPLINSFTIYKVPAAPPRQTMWDGILEVFLNIWAVHPDIQACVTVGGRTGCAAECSDADTGNPERRCTQPFAFNLPRTGSIRVEVWDNDPGARRQLMAAGDVDVADPCLKLTAHPPCEIRSAHADDDPLLISFDSPERSVIPSSLPPHPDGTPPPSSGPASTPPSTSPAPVERSAPAAAPGAAARTLTPTPAARTPEAIDAALNLRDADRCEGGDAYFPTGGALASSAVGVRLGPERTNRLYQAAALMMAVSDPTARSNLLTAITSRADGGDLIDVMNALSPVQGQAIVLGYQSTARSFVGQMVTTGLDQLLAQPRPASALEPEVNRWIAARLATVPLASEAVDRIFAGPSVSAECTVNQLAKDGFTAAVTGR